MRTSDARGFGTTISLVLTVIGILLIVLLGSEVIGQSSRLTLERAIGASRANDIARQAIEEMFLSERCRLLLVGHISDALGNVEGGSSIPREDRIPYFLTLLDPASHEDESTPAGLKPQSRGGTFPITKIAEFKGAEVLEVVPEQLLAAWKEEVSRGDLKVSTVQLKAAHYKRKRRPRGGVSTYTAVPSAPEGLARAQVTVSVRMGRQVHARRRIE